jgi:arabinofuranosyltransferase
MLFLTRRWIPISRWFARRWLPLAAYFVAVVGFASNRNARLQFPLDDAWIHRVYSRSFAWGQGFAFNPGQQEAGSTSPLWAIITSPLHWLEVLGSSWVVVLVKLLGVILCLMAVLTVRRIAGYITASRLAGTIAATLFAIQPRLLFSSLSGMEIPLLVALWIFAVYAYHKKHWLLTSILLGLSPVARPEALLLLPLAVFPLWQLCRAKRQRRALFIASIATILPVSLWALYCLHVNGHPFPNTFYLKAHRFTWDFAKTKLVIDALAQHGIVHPWILPIACTVFIWQCGKRCWFTSVSLVIMPVLFALGVVGTRDISLDGYYWTRWIDPAAIVLNAAAVLALGILAGIVVFKMANRDYHRLIFVRLGIGPALIFAWMISAPGFVASYCDRRMHIASDSRAIKLMNVRMGKWLRGHSSANAVIAVNDAGAIRYFSNRKTIDLIGLNHSGVAFGELNRDQAIAQSDWLVIFPSWFSDKEASIASEFRVQNRIAIPLQEYTVCPCSGQTEIVAWKKVVR